MYDSQTGFVTDLDEGSLLIVRGTAFLPSKCIFPYLTQDETVLNQIRRFRDEELKKSKAGKELIKLYYQHAPEMVSILLK
ncbi:MAG: hypothetical protein ACE5WD_14130 [Candidatus Aminicenantia bacterium]